jgi:hypothetical protein
MKCKSFLQKVWETATCVLILHSDNRGVTAGFGTAFGVSVRFKMG